MRLFALALATLSAAPLLAHPGHGATPAHVHVGGGVGGGVPVDVGALAFVVVVGVAGLVVALRRRT